MIWRLHQQNLCPSLYRGFSLGIDDLSRLATSHPTLNIAAFSRYASPKRHFLRFRVDLLLTSSFSKGLGFSALENSRRSFQRLSGVLILPLLSQFRSSAEVGLGGSECTFFARCGQSPGQSSGQSYAEPKGPRPRFGQHLEESKRPSWVFHPSSQSLNP